MTHYSDADVIAAIDAVLDRGELLPVDVIDRLTDSQRESYSRAVDRRQFAVHLEMQRMRERHPGLPLPPGMSTFMFAGDVPDDASSLTE